MTKYLAIALLITGFLVGDAYGEDGVYYCAQTDSNGFYFDEKLKKYARSGFHLTKFKIKFDRIAKTIEIKGYSDGGTDGIYNCTASLMASYPEELTCHSKFYSLNFNSDNGRFVFFTGYAYFNGDGDSIAVSYGKCDKF